MRYIHTTLYQLVTKKYFIVIIKKHEFQPVKPIGVEIKQHFLFLTYPRSTIKLQIEFTNSTPKLLKNDECTIYNCQMGPTTLVHQKPQVV